MLGQPITREEEEYKHARCREVMSTLNMIKTILFSFTSLSSIYLCLTWAGSTLCRYRWRLLVMCAKSWGSVLFSTSVHGYVLYFESWTEPDSCHLGTSIWDCNKGVYIMLIRMMTRCINVFDGISLSLQRMKWDGCRNFAAWMIRWTMKW